jgi:gamma-glutamyltranspeptidase/glutathione hydrolase
MPQGSTFTTRPQLAGTFGMVASTHWLATAAGMAMLEKGGNAFDAAVATGLVLQVVEPHMNGLGGEVPIIAYRPRGGGAGSDGAGSGGAGSDGAGPDGVFVVGGQGSAPASATIEAFDALGLPLVPGSGLLAACVPGAFGAWMLLASHGRLPLRDVMESAIGYAGQGYPILAEASADIATMAGVFSEHWPTSARVYLAGGVPAGGSRFANPDLAATYTRLLAEAEAAGTDRLAQIEAARRAFYQGFVAEAIGAYLARAEVMDGTGERHKGLLAADDMAGWRPSVEAPATLDYQGLTVCKTQPWGQGPVFLQQLALLDGFGLGDMEPGGVDHIHTVVECAKLAFADREAWYGDPAFTAVPLRALLSPEYTRARRELVGPSASDALRPGSPGGATPHLPGFVTGQVAVAGPGWDGEPTAAHSAGAHSAGAGSRAAQDAGTRGGGDPGRRDTCHLDVIDRFGNVVAATPSGGWLQSSPVIPGLGFCLGTRGQMFALTPGLPGSLAPGKRPRTTLSPSMALRDGEPYLAFGTPGGDQQDQWSLGFFLNHVHFGLNLQEAIDAPAFHTSHFPSSFYPRESNPLAVDVEERVGQRVIDGLRERGHLVTVRLPWSLGRVSAVARAGGFLYAGANPRGMRGYAIGR